MTEAIEYVWEVPNLEFTLVDGDKQNVVTVIDWIVTKTLDSHSFSSHGNVSISAPSGSFVEYENITEAKEPLPEAEKYKDIKSKKEFL
mgnify:CR=1 FL=1